MTEFNKEYWKKRCDLAEKLIKANYEYAWACDFNAYKDFISSPDAIELYSEKTADEKYAEFYNDGFSDGLEAAKSQF